MHSLSYLVFLWNAEFDLALFLELYVFIRRRVWNCGYRESKTTIILIQTKDCIPKLFLKTMGCWKYKCKLLGGTSGKIPLEGYKQLEWPLLSSPRFLLLLAWNRVVVFGAPAAMLSHEDILRLTSTKDGRAEKQKEPRFHLTPRQVHTCPEHPSHICWRNELLPCFSHFYFESL